MANDGGLASLMRQLSNEAVFPWGVSLDWWSGDSTCAKSAFWITRFTGRNKLILKFVIDNTKKNGLGYTSAGTMLNCLLCARLVQAKCLYRISAGVLVMTPLGYFIFRFYRRFRTVPAFIKVSVMTRGVLRLLHE